MLAHPSLLLLLLLLLLSSLCFINASSSSSSSSSSRSSSSLSNLNKNKKVLLVVGSINADTFLPVSRIPTEGENLTLLPDRHPIADVPGGKGCTQAVAASKLSSASASTQQGLNGVEFLCRFGDDDIARTLREVLVQNNVDLRHCNTGGIKLSSSSSSSSSDCNIPSGRGYVLLTPSGNVCAVVSGGSNAYGWREWERYYHNTVVKNPTKFKDEDTDERRNKKTGTNDEQKEDTNEDDDAVEELTEEYFDELFRDKNCILLQREIPEYVNEIIVREACKRKRRRNNNDDVDDDLLIIQDVGGEDRMISTALLSLCDYIIPNETELARLLHSLNHNNDDDKDDEEEEEIKMTPPSNSNNNHEENRAIKDAKALQRYGAKNVLVTLGSRGSILLRANGQIIRQDACGHFPKGCAVMDETGAGDCFRAAFAVALMESRPSRKGQTATLRRCLEFASAAGALAVTKQGAVPSVPSREEVERMCQLNFRGDCETKDNHSSNEPGDLHDGHAHAVAGAEGVASLPRGGKEEQNDDDDECPLMFGSRLNSMKDRPELWSKSLSDVREWVKRQGTVRGLGCVDFNYPQHFQTWTVKDAKDALDEVGLAAGAVCLRYPSKFTRGAMNHPDATLRREAIDLTKKAAEVARQLGFDEVVVWSAYDGYDYPFQVDYDEKWSQLVRAFRECCDGYPDIKFSIEFKPTDENTRFFTVPSTGAAVLLVNEIDRPNMGLTLDVGHMLMAGENPAQSIAMAGKRLFGVQLNDGYTRLAAEDGLMFGSVHPSMALEAIYQLQRIGFKGHLYFDTFPQRTDPVREAEYNIRRVKAFWRAAKRLNSKVVRTVTDEHDALGALDLVNDALRST